MKSSIRSRNDCSSPRKAPRPSFTFTQGKRLHTRSDELARRREVSGLTLLVRARTMKSRALILLVPAALALSACAVVPGNPSYGYGYGYDAGPAWVEPAPYYYQTVPPSPYVGGIWIEGSWNDEHGRREWRPGHWVPPHPGDVHGRPPHRGDGRYAGDQGHRPPRTGIGDGDARGDHGHRGDPSDRVDRGDRGERGDGRPGGAWASEGRSERGAGRPPLSSGAAFGVNNPPDPRITPP